MLPPFHPRHIPGLFVASTMTFGGAWGFVDTRACMLAFGLPARIASATAASHPVFLINNARTTVIGLLTFLFYSRGQLDAVDSIMAVTGAYCGLVDSYVVWKEGSPGKAIFRLVSSGLISAWGFWGCTKGW
ncbi:hypothetical protein GGS20DRAFT_526594 [Poronia punctata]|nr:hypothetical protein GGS20DRAFT_526594 [Poronia punctata]